jgi:hypothetical protein
MIAEQKIAGFELYMNQRASVDAHLAANDSKVESKHYQ